MSNEKLSNEAQKPPLCKGVVVHRFLLTEKPRIGKFPLKFKFSFRRNEWYLLPQGWSHLHTAKDEGSRNRFEYHYKYNFSWLFIDMEWTQRLRRVGL